jgi:hypothetical protein
VLFSFHSHLPHLLPSSTAVWIISLTDEINRRERKIERREKFKAGEIMQLCN